MRKIYSAMAIVLISLSAFVSGAAELETKFITYGVSGQVTSTIYDDVSSIKVIMPVGTDLATLAPAFSLSEGAKALIGEVEQVSGTVVDFSAGTVEYNVVNDTVEQTWYVTAIEGAMVTFNVDMTGAGLVEGDEVYVTGDFVGWNQPGTGASVLMSDADGDSIYTAMAYAPASSQIKYKYFKNASWDNGDPISSGDRTLQVGTESVEVNPIDIWGEEIVKITFNVDMTSAELVEGDVVYVTGSFVGWNQPGTGKSALMSDKGEGIWTVTVPVTKNMGEIKYKYFKNASWDNGDPLASGDRVLVVAEENITIDPANIWGSEDIPDAIDQDQLELVSTYPNPFKDQITITNLDNASEVVVSNLIGQVLRAESVNSNEVTINTSEFRSGIYLIVIKGEAGSSRAIRVVKQ